MKIPFGSKHLDATLCIPAEDGDVRTAVVLTHGAGGDMNFKHLVSLSEVLAATGILCLRFTCKGLNLFYRVKAYSAVVVRDLSVKHDVLLKRYMYTYTCITAFSYVISYVFVSFCRNIYKT